MWPVLVQAIQRLCTSLYRVVEVTHARVCPVCFELKGRLSECSASVFVKIFVDDIGQYSEGMF